MAGLLSSNQRAFLASITLAILATQVPNCSNNSSDSGAEETSSGGSIPIYPTGGKGSGGSATVGASNTGGNSPITNTGGANAAGGNATGGAPSTGGTRSSNTAATGGIVSDASSDHYTVALIQSSESDASSITQDEVNSMVNDAITQAGGLDFIQDNTTVVLKPNLLTHLAMCYFGTATLPPTVNGVSVDWRITKAVADLVRAKNPNGKIYVMEGSNRNTTAAFAALGYTSPNFGTSVDEFIPLEGPAGCADRSQTGLVQKPGKSGKLYWINEQYFNADYLISIGALKTHSYAGITGCVKNLGIGATPNAMYSVSTDNSDCTRNMSTPGVDSYIDHTDGIGPLSDFIADFYSVKPPDFAIMDGLQGMQNGPCSYNAADKMNMRLILASKNAVALDTVEALVMNCDPTKVLSLTKAESYGLGTTDPNQIAVVGNRQIADVKKSFVSGTAGVCN